MSRLDPNVLNEILERCLIKLQAGQGIETVLDEYPACKDSLRPVLEAMQAVWTSRGSDTVPVAAMTRSRNKLMKAVYDLKQAPPQPWWQRQFGFMRHVMIPVVTVLVCFGLLFTGIASAQALPGQALYPVKLAAEQLALSLPASPSAQLAREENYDARRKDEVEELIDQQEYEEVHLTGFLNQGGSTGWQLDSLEIVIDPQMIDIVTDFDGHFVTVEAELLPNRQMKVESIEARVYMIVGRVQKLEPERVQVEDIWIQIGPETNVIGALEFGVQVEVTVTRISNDGYMAVKIIPVGLAKSDASHGLQKKKSTQTEEIKLAEPVVKTEEPASVDAEEDFDEPEVTPTVINTRVPWPTRTRLPENHESPSVTPETENNPTDNDSPAETETPKDEEEDSHSTSTPDYDDYDGDYPKAIQTPAKPKDD